MKIKFYSLIVLTGLVMAACAPAAVLEPEPSPVIVMEVSPTAKPLPAATETPTAEVMSGEVSFSDDIWPVILRTALSAHGEMGGVSLENYDEIMKYVMPGKPEKSELMDALTGTNGHPVMPPVPFPPETIQLFYDWILQGAKNN